MDITLTADLLLIRPLPDPDPVTAWGFVLPPTPEHTDTPLRGLVLAAGPGRIPRLSKAGTELVRAFKTLVEAHSAAPGSTPVWNTAIEALAANEQAPERVLMQVKAGDTVIYSKHGFQKFRIDGEDLVVTQEASILGVIEK